MGTEAKSGYGVSLSWNGHTVAEITEVGGLKISSEFKDVTNHSSASRFREKIATLLKAENIPIKGNFIPGDSDGQIAMIADCKNQIERTAIIIFPSSIIATWTLRAYVGSFEIVGFGIDSSIEFTCELEPTGESDLDLGESGGLSALTGIQENTGAALDFIPDFANGTYLYTVAVNAVSDYVKFTPTGALHTITIQNGFDGSTVTVSTGAQSGELLLGAVGTVTLFTITAQESGKVARVYNIYVTRAAA